MEPPSKRPRLSVAPEPDPNLVAEHGDDETDPVDLEAARARNDQRLKSIFESIFQKYEKDFTEVGDEIDLQSGHIIVNNGHLQRMEGEDDTGEKNAGWLAGLATPVVGEEESGSETESGGDGYEEGHYDAAAAGGESQLWSESRGLPQKSAWEGNLDGEPAGAADADAGEYTDAYSDDNEKDDEDEDESEEEEDDDDDNSSVDSLLDDATSVHYADNSRPAEVTARTPTTTIPTTEKAVPAAESASMLSRIRDADYSSYSNRAGNKHEPVDSKWRTPEIDAKFATPSTWSRKLPTSPSSNNNKQTSNTNAVRSVSPPGARSLWALPYSGRSRKTNTDVPNKKDRNIDVPSRKQKNKDVPNQKEKNTDIRDQKERNKDINVSAKKIALDSPTPTSISKPKPKSKPFSSPGVANDWSFAGAPDESESDDPLQEDYQPSPMPKTALNIRGRRIGSSGSLSASQSRCNGCKRLFSSNDDHVLHLRCVLASDLPGGQHDRAIVKKILERIDEAHARDTDSQSKAIDSPPAHRSPTPKDTNTNGDRPSAITPAPTRGKYAPITPIEAKLIITMRHVQKKPWKEVLDYFPGRRLTSLIKWNQFHWTGRRAHLPPLSRPWSSDERDKLSAFTDPQGMTWPGIRAELPGRSSAEIECEMFRLWVGDEVWNGGEGQLIESSEHHYQDQQTGVDGGIDASEVTRLESIAPADQEEPNSDADSTVGDYPEIPDSTESSVTGSNWEDTHNLYNPAPKPDYSKMLHNGLKSISPKPYDSIQGRRIVTLRYRGIKR